jgi:DNA-binding NarL/FixJ family response regulator
MPGRLKYSEIDLSMPSRRFLTPRELEVLELLANGASTTALATNLGISKRTVEVHLAHALTKLRARNRIHAVALIVKAGLIDPQPTDAGDLE